MFSLDNSFIQVFPYTGLVSERDSFVSVVGQPSAAIPNAIQDVLPFQFKPDDGRGNNLASLFWKLYAPGTNPTVAELNALQAYLRDGDIIRARLMRKNGNFLFNGGYSRFSASPLKYITFGVPFNITPFVDELCYLEFAFKMPDTEVWDDTNGFQGQWVYLLQTDLFRVKSSIIQPNEQCYFTKIQYRDVNAYGFVYDFIDNSEVEEFTNSLRIPVRVQKPQIRTKVERYKDSAGFYRNINAGADFEYELDTEWCDVHFHKCLAVALLHNNLILNGDRYVMSAEYDIAYQSLPVPSLAKGKAKLVLTPFGNSSPNFI